VKGNMDMREIDMVNINRSQLLSLYAVFLWLLLSPGIHSLFVEVNIIGVIQLVLGLSLIVVAFVKPIRDWIEARRIPKRNIYVLIVFLCLILGLELYHIIGLERYSTTNLYYHIFDVIVLSMLIIVSIVQLLRLVRNK
jgi:hypothetical protein